MDGLLGWIVFTVGIVLAGIGVFALIISPLLVAVIAAAVGLAIFIAGPALAARSDGRDL